jgi:ubiquinone/menaquinone biosynthesis C-methylase UbiE
MSGQAYDKGVAGYDRSFGLPMRQFVPTLVKLGGVAPSQSVLDVATGTGIAAEEALRVVGPSGHVTAVDIMPPMLELARQRLAFDNVTIALADAEALPFPTASFDTVLCSMALMIFNDRARALSGFHRVLRQGGRLAVSLNTAPERTLAAGIRLLIARHVPARRATIEANFSHHYGLGAPDRPRALFLEAGFRDVETMLETRSFQFPSFDEYFEPFEQGGGPWGEEYVALPAELRRLIRNDRHHELGGGTGPITVDVDILFCCGRK